LVATCIAEEGLDIPSVELVVFYEPIPSEIRYIQRRGRTGRKKFGKVKILITQDTIDEGFYFASLKREKQMRDVVSRLEKELNVTIPRTSLIQTKKEDVTNFNAPSKKNVKIKKRKCTKDIPCNISSEIINLDIKKRKIKNTPKEKYLGTAHMVTNFKPTTTKGLSKALKWVLKRVTECDNGEGVNIKYFLKISTLEDYNPDLILAVISQLIQEGLFFQPTPLKISIVQ